MSVQEALRLLRLELGLTQDDLAKKLNKAYITVSRWENGKGFPNRGNSKKIIELARRGHASKECLSYLNEVLLPDTKRVTPARAYGFPDIDREFLFQLADGSTNALYVIDAKDYRLLYANRKAENIAVTYLTALGLRVRERSLSEQADKRCYHYFADRSEPCPFCPLKESTLHVGTDFATTTTIAGRNLRVQIKTMEMGGRVVHVMYLVDITQDEAEREALFELANDIPTAVGIYHVYADERIELAFMNNVMFNLIGVERGRRLMENGPADLLLLHPDDKPALMAELRSAVAEGRCVRANIRLKVSRERYQLMQLDARLIKHGEDKLTFYCLFNSAD